MKKFTLTVTFKSAYEEHSCEFPSAEKLVEYLKAIVAARKILNADFIYGFHLEDDQEIRSLDEFETVIDFYNGCDVIVYEYVSEEDMKEHSISSFSEESFSYVEMDLTPKECFQISRNIPQPIKAVYYPFDQLKVGDSFFAPSTKKGQTIISFRMRIFTSFNRFIRENGKHDWKIRTAAEGKGLRVWRVR